MSAPRFSERATRDLESIADYTAKQWSDRQAATYLRELYDLCMLIARMPGIGTPCRRFYLHAPPALMRFGNDSHAIIYESAPDGVEILRILHKSMQPDPIDFER